MLVTEANLPCDAPMGLGQHVLHVCSFTHFSNTTLTWASNICHAALQGALGEAVLEMLHSAAFIPEFLVHAA